MPPSDHAQRVAELFKSAIDCDPKDRESFLQQRCGSNSDTRAEVESLLQSHARAEKFLERSAANIAAERFGYTGAFAPGTKVGNYEIISLIGKGGMGEVYLAQDRQLNRRVALKLVRQGMDTENVVRRFLQEQQLLASLNHPNIAQLYGAGVTSDGIPYFAMENVDGTRIDDYCREKKLKVEHRLELFGKVCAAVHYAHQHLVVHRDLKPSNILVTNDGEPKLLDFGIAKLLDAVTNIAPEQTITLQNVLTPEYASPEHIRGDPITTASDIYSLGVLLYELLTEAKPYKIDNRTPIEIARVISEREPTRPSDNPESKIQNRKSLRGDLDNIVLMAMRKEPQRRYSSIAQLAADIRRHLDGLPVHARKDTLSYRSSKFVKRNGVAVGAAALVGLAIVTALIVSVLETQNARRERDVAQRERVKAERINEFLQRTLSFSNQSITSVSPVAQKKDVTVNDMLNQITPQIEAELADEPEVRGKVLHAIGSAYASQGRHDQAEKNLRTALEIAEKQPGGANDPDAILLKQELGALAALHGKLQEAENLLQQAVESWRELRKDRREGFQIVKLAFALDNLGVLRWMQGKTSEATALFQEGFQLLGDAQGIGEKSVRASLQTDYGGLLVMAGQVTKGEPLLRQSLQEYRKIFAQPRWEMGATLTMLGQAAAAGQNFDDAIQFLEEGEKVYRDTLGSSNSYVAYNLGQQAVVLSARKDLKAAEEKAREAIATWRAISPNGKLAPADTCRTLAQILMKQNRSREAESYYRQAIAGYDSQAKKNYSAIVSLKLSLSQALLAQKRAVEAERIAHEASIEAEQNLGPENPMTNTAAQNLATIRNQPH